jgi:nitrile hydratase
VAVTFAPEQRVRIRADYPPGYLRTPYYCRGKVGTVERVLPAFVNPEEAAYGRVGGPHRVLYRVRFAMRDLWPDYAGPPHDAVEIEIFEHWLEPAE